MDTLREVTPEGLISWREYIVNEVKKSFLLTPADRKTNTTTNDMYNLQLKLNKRWA
jgi:hypothetical protein